MLLLALWEHTFKAEPEPPPALLNFCQKISFYQCFPMEPLIKDVFWGFAPVLSSQYEMNFVSKASLTPLSLRDVPIKARGNIR